MAVATYIPFEEQRKSTDRSSTLDSFKDPFELLYVDITDIRFLAKSAVDPNYCLLFTDLFTSETYTCDVQKRKKS